MPASQPPRLNLASSSLFEVLVLGAGPAGVSAALARCRVKRSVAIFSAPTFRNDKAHRAHNVLGHDHIPPAEIRAKGRADIEKYGTTRLVDRAVVQARKVDEDNTRRKQSVDERRIKRLVHLENDRGIDIRFEDGSTAEVGFLSHIPPTVVNAPDLLESLGVEVKADAFGGTFVQRSEPFGETNIKGVFAAGDLGVSMAKAVAVAMFQGMVAGAGANFSITADDD